MKKKNLQTNEEPQKSEYLKNAGDLVKAMGKMIIVPFAAIHHIATESRDEIDEAMRNVEIADHEGGHLFIGMLNDEEFKHFWRTAMPHKIAKKMSLAGGFVAKEKINSIFKTGLTLEFVKLLANIKENLNRGNIKYEDIIKDFALLMAGEAADYSQDTKEKSKKERLEIIKEEKKKSERCDFARIDKIFDLLSGRWKDNKEEIIEILFSDLVEFFKDEKARKVINIFSHELLIKKDIHNNGEEINSMMMELLEKEGISKGDFEEIRKKYEEMVKNTVEKCKKIFIASLAA